MGSVTRYDYCDRFIDEFKNDVLKQYPFPAEMRPQVEIDELIEQVYLFLTIKDSVGTEHRVHLLNCLYYPEANDDEVVERIHNSLPTLSESEIIARLKKADIID